MPGAFDVNVGTLTQVWTTAEYNAGSCPKVGTSFYNENLSVGPVGWYIFLRNSGSSAITAKSIAASATTSRAWTSTSVTATSSQTPACALGSGAANNQPFAGCRISGATSMAQNEFGWFQISGGATLTADASGTTADAYVTSSNATAGAVEALASTAAVDAVNAFGIARTTTTSGDVLVDLTNSVWAQR